MILPIRRDSKESDDITSLSKSCCWVSYTESSASRLDIIVTVNMFSGDNVERRLVIIFFSLIFYHIQHNFCVINDNDKDWKPGAGSTNKTPMSYDTILIKAERHMACPPNSG